MIYKKIIINKIKEIAMLHILYIVYIHVTYYVKCIRKPIKLNISTLSIVVACNITN